MFETTDTGVLLTESRGGLGLDRQKHQVDPGFGDFGVEREEDLAVETLVAPRFTQEVQS